MTTAFFLGLGAPCSVIAVAALTTTARNRPAPCSCGLSFPTKSLVRRQPFAHTASHLADARADSAQQGALYAPSPATTHPNAHQRSIAATYAIVDFANHAATRRKELRCDVAHAHLSELGGHHVAAFQRPPVSVGARPRHVHPVSYTHLTLPTIYSV